MPLSAGDGVALVGDIDLGRELPGRGGERGPNVTGRFVQQTQEDREEKRRSSRRRSGQCRLRPVPRAWPDGVPPSERSGDHLFFGVAPGVTRRRRGHDTVEFIGRTPIPCL